MCAGGLGKNSGSACGRRKTWDQRLGLVLKGGKEGKCVGQSGKESVRRGGMGRERSVDERLLKLGNRKDPYPGTASGRGKSK